MKDPTTPPIGGFPGSARGNALFTAWSAALCAGANSWNKVWDETLAGNLTFQVWAKAVAGSLEASYAFMEQAMATSLGVTAPPWAAIQSRNPQSVPILRPVDPGSFRETVTLTLLNGIQEHFPVANVTALSANKLRVIISDAEAQKIIAEQGRRDNEKGDGQHCQFIGLVFTKAYPDPIAILTVSAKPFMPK